MKRLIRAISISGKSASRYRGFGKTDIQSDPFSGNPPAPLPPQESRKNPMSDILHRLYACCSHCLFLCIPPCREVLAVIVLKFHLKYNSGPHTEISVKEPLHRFRVPGKYHNDILSVVFHFPKQCRNSDLALQRICFINE